MNYYYYYYMIYIAPISKIESEALDNEHENIASSFEEIITQNNSV